MWEPIQRFAAALEPANQIVRQHLRTLWQTALIRMHQVHRHTAGLIVTKEPAQTAVSQFRLQQVGRQPRNAGAGQCGFFQQAVMVAGERSRHAHPQQFMLLVIEPLFATAVVTVEQTAMVSECLRCHRFAVLFKISRAGAGHFVPGQ